VARRLTTEDLISEVRSMIDESNITSVRDDQDILPALNRAQDVAANILARHYESPMLAYEEVSLTAGQSEYPIPENAFEQRLEKIEVQVNNLFYQVKRIDYRDSSAYESLSIRTNVPYYYAVIGNKYRLLPSPTATYPLRIWYLKDPEPLVRSQGRITFVKADVNYIIVDSIGSELTVSNADLNCYANLIDGQTGEVRATMQIASIQGNKITFKSVFGPNDRTSVLNKTISSNLANITVQPDDFICTIHGTCIPIMKKPFSNYLIQYAVAEMQRKLGGPADMELKVKQDLETIVERSWVGRETSLRVSRNNRNWEVPPRRFYDGR
jgi:hypothetical protein